jgi:nitrilase
MNAPARVACAQVEPVIFERDATLDKLAIVAAEAAAGGARLVLFPETFVPVYPSARWARSLAVWGEGGKELWARLAQASITVPSADTERMGAVAREHGIVLAVGVNELGGGTLYNTLLVFTPDGHLALRHRKLMPTNHERMVWGLGDGEGLAAIETEVGRVGGLICWENLMPLARAALYESGLDIYLAPTADDEESWQRSIRHIAREARAFVLSCCVYQRASSYPDDVAIADGPDLLGRGGSAIVGPTVNISPARSGTRKGFSTPTSSRITCSPSASASIRSAITRGRTCCGSRLRRFVDRRRRCSRNASSHSSRTSRRRRTAAACARNVARCRSNHQRVEEDALPGYTIVNLMDLENLAVEGGSTLEARFARDAIGSEHIGVSHIRYAPERRSSRGHSHREQEEVYLVLGGSGHIKLDDELRDLRRWDLVRVAPGTFRGFSAGPDGLELLAIGSDRPEGGDAVYPDDPWWGD